MKKLLFPPSSSWEEKNIYLAKSLEISGETDPAVFHIEFTQLRQQVENTFAQIPVYTPCSRVIEDVMKTATDAIILQEHAFEVRCLKDGSHAYWRQYQSTIKRWSSVVESLVHERGPWGELLSHENE